MKAPFYSKANIISAADAFLDEWNASADFPIPIERIVEQMGIDIVPIPGLQQSSDVVAFISSDLTRISVDQAVYEYREPRYRFSLAHEVGHSRLHKELFDSLSFDSIAAWKSSVGEIPEDEYRYLEYHANCFAGHVLVPREMLAREFRKAIAAIPGSLDVRENLDIVRDYVEPSIGTTFNVSSAVIRRRTDDDKLWLEL